MIYILESCLWGFYLCAGGKTRRAARSREWGPPRFSLSNLIWFFAVVNRTRHKQAPNLRSTRVFRGFGLRAPTARNGHHSALENRVFNVTPANAVRTKTREPDHKMNGVPQRYKPNLPA